MYVETGLNLNFNFASVPVDDNDLEDYLSNQYQFAALAVPVNFAYKFDINDTFDIKPYLGLNLKLNLIGKNRLKITDDDLRDLMEDEGYDLDDYEEWGSVFNKDDMGGKNATWNRFQLGWHIGADFVFNKFFAGLSYGTDFIPAFSYKKNKINTATFNVGVGLYF